jgi:uncharacterized protein DUF1326
VPLIRRHYFTVKTKIYAAAKTTNNQIPNWFIKSDYVETCNCEYGCPCNFSGFATYGNCNAIVLFHIRSGSYGNTKLDSPDFIVAESWPKAIHEEKNIIIDQDICCWHLLLVAITYASYYSLPLRDVAMTLLAVFQTDVIEHSSAA